MKSELKYIFQVTSTFMKDQNGFVKMEPLLKIGKASKISPAASILLKAQVEIISMSKHKSYVKRDIFRLTQLKFFFLELQYWLWDHENWSKSSFIFPTTF